MEQLHRRSDGLVETPSGGFAISSLRISGSAKNPETGQVEKWFDFKPAPYGDTIRIVWSDDIAIIPEDVARVMLARGYAAHITDEQLDTWNDLAPTAEPARKGSTGGKKDKTQDEPPVVPVADPAPAPAPENIVDPVPEIEPAPAPVVEPVVDPAPAPATDDAERQARLAKALEEAAKTKKGNA